MLELEFSGDMYNRLGDEDPCGYFDLIIAINSLKSMGQKLSCSSHPSIHDSQSLLNALPSDITKNDLDYTLDGLYTFKYPQDFKAIRFKSNGKQSMALMLPTIMDIQDPFSVEAKIAFDVHMADFAIDLVSYETEDEGSNV